MSDGERRDPGFGYEAEDDDYYTYDATDEDEEGGRRPVVFLAIVALLVVFAGVVFLAYKQGLKQGAQGNPPVIHADSSPSKVAPADPGGMEIPHQDRTVYDRISGDKPSTSDGEHLLPTPEEPLPVQKSAPPVTQQEMPPAASNAPQQIAPTMPPANQPQTQMSEMPPVQAAPVPPVSTSPSPSAPAAPEKTTTPAAASSNGGYVGQLAAFRDEPAARAEFRKLQKKYPVLAGLTADIQKADLGEKGIYYRLRAGYLDKAKAQDLCTALKAQGQGCLVRPK